MTMEKRVDDDWKKRAEEEKARIDQKATEKDEARRPGPPATFMTLVSSVASQAVIAFGDVENPLTGKMEKDLDAARFSIDLLAALEEKTRGNLTEAESRLLQEALHGLRLRYVEASRNPA